jgi:hypothetical protein
VGRRDTLPPPAVLLLVLAIAAGVGSFLTAASAEKLRDYAATVRPARATLRALEVKRWFPDLDHWSAFGTFDIVAGDHRGTAEGSLIPSSFYRSKPRRYRVPREEAARFLAGWQVGATYDGFWNPEHPEGVFFEPVPYEDEERLTFWLRMAAGVLLTGAVLVARSRPRAVAG